MMFAYDCVRPYPHSHVTGACHGDRQFLPFPASSRLTEIGKEGFCGRSVSIDQQLRRGETSVRTSFRIEAAAASKGWPTSTAAASWTLARARVYATRAD